MAIRRAVPLSEQIAAELQIAIVRGDDPAGSILTEDALATRYDVSRVPVREAIRILESRHLIVKSGRSYRVAGLDKSDLDEVYRLRLAVEALGWHYLKSDGTDPSPLDDALTAMAEAADRDDPDAFAVADIDFHSAAVRLSGRRRVVGMWDQIEPSMRLILQITNIIDGELHDVHQRHVKLLEALRTGTDEELSTMVRAHIQDSWHLLD